MDAYKNASLARGAGVQKWKNNLIPFSNVIIILTYKIQ